jgi:hypothetical protein
MPQPIPLPKREGKILVKMIELNSAVSHHPWVQSSQKKHDAWYNHTLNSFDKHYPGLLGDRECADEAMEKVR